MLIMLKFHTNCPTGTYLLRSLQHTAELYVTQHTNSVLDFYNSKGQQQFKADLDISTTTKRQDDRDLTQNMIGLLRK